CFHFTPGGGKTLSGMTLFHCFYLAAIAFTLKICAPILKFF
ncbi:hypothetical protein HMPREF7215_0244, partial [Pyramidobacter piscolens W5455]